MISPYCVWLTPRTWARACERPPADEGGHGALGYGCDVTNLLHPRREAKRSHSLNNAGQKLIAFYRPCFVLLAHHAGSDDVADYYLLSGCRQERNCQACDEPRNSNAG